MMRRPPSIKHKLITLLRRAGIVIGIAAVLAAFRSLAGQPELARTPATPPVQPLPEKQPPQPEGGPDAQGGYTTVEEVPHEEKWVPTPRRRFLLQLSVAAGGLGAAIVSVPVIGFLLTPVIREQVDIWEPVGDIDEFPIGSTVEVAFRDAEQLPWAGFAAQTAAYVRRDEIESFTAFSIYCTHTGCPVRWLEEANLFLCPCHGGVFERDGSPTAGPPTVPLARYAVRVRDRQVEIQTAPIPIAGTERLEE